MPTSTTAIEIHASAADTFDLIHDYSRRLEWDPFLRAAYLLNNAPIAGVGVSSRCVARWAAGGLAMESTYVSFVRPRIAAVTLTRGPFFLAAFSASIRHETINDTTTRVIYTYNFRSQPRWLALLIDPMIRRVFHRETIQRLAALKRFLQHLPVR